MLFKRLDHNLDAFGTEWEMVMRRDMAEARYRMKNSLKDRFSRDLSIVDLQLRRFSRTAIEFVILALFELLWTAITTTMHIFRCSGWVSYDFAPMLSGDQSWAHRR